jgi:hypothetical protein
MSEERRPAWKAFGSALFWAVIEDVIGNITAPATERARRRLSMERLFVAKPSSAARAPLQCGQCLEMGSALETPSCMTGNILRKNNVTYAKRNEHTGGL